jgi:hypothetical protein
LLLLGRFEEGWNEYEWRKRLKNPMGARTYAQPLWSCKKKLTDKTILLHAEQGFGDTIQFARFATLVARRGARVVLQVQDELKEILSGIDGVSCTVGMSDSLPSFDCHCPLLSLPLELQIRVEDLPTVSPYLVAPRERVTAWEHRLSQTGKIRVAIAWAGRPTFIDDHNRSIGLQRFSPLLAAAGVQFFSIQKVLNPGDEEIIKRHPNVIHLGHEIADFGDTAAIMSLMDLVVSSDTSVVHLAGALGVPVWILLQHAADWRWLMDREDSPWYPSARLFRQSSIGDWSGVVHRVLKELPI